MKGNEGNEPSSRRAIEVIVEGGEEGEEGGVIEGLGDGGVKLVEGGRCVNGNAGGGVDVVEVFKELSKTRAVKRGGGAAMSRDQLRQFRWLEREEAGQRTRRDDERPCPRALLLLRCRAAGELDSLICYRLSLRGIRAVRQKRMLSRAQVKTERKGRTRSRRVAAYAIATTSALGPYTSDESGLCAMTLTVSRAVVRHRSRMGRTGPGNWRERERRIVWIW